MGKCPHCGSNSIRKRYREHRRYKWRCRSCNKVFRRPSRPVLLWLGIAFVVCTAIVGAYVLQQDSTPVRPISFGSFSQSQAAAVADQDKTTATSTSETAPILAPSPRPKPTPVGVEVVATSTPKPTPSVRPSPTQNATSASLVKETSTPVAQTSALSERKRATESVLEEFENGGWVNHHKPHIATTIASVRWIEDGVDSSESEAVQELVNLAAFHSQLTTALLELGWLSDGVTDIESNAIKYMGYLASDNESIAMKVIGFTWLEDGVTESEAASLDSLAFIAQKSESIAARLTDVPWFVDGVTKSEAEQLKYFDYLVEDSETTAVKVMEIPWFRDGVEQIEVKAVNRLGFVAQGSVEAANLVAEMDWFLDGADDREVEAIESLAYVSRSDGEIAERVAGMAWFTDGIDASESEGLKYVSFLIEDDELTARHLIGMSWFQDGITESEAEGIEYFRYLVKDSQLAARAVVESAWFRDGLTELEIGALDSLSYLARSDPAVAAQVTSMPFLSSVEPVDIAAVRSLDGLALDHPDRLERILDHSSLSGGITDVTAPVAAVLLGVTEKNPPLVEKLLEPGAVDIERRTATLPLAGEADLVILRTSPGASSGMDSLEFAVRFAEEFVGEPFPTRYVALLYEKAVSEGYGGTNFGTHIAILPEYDVDDDSEPAKSAFGNIAHEVAHYYWSGNADWIDEGLAEYMTSAAESIRTGKAIGVFSGPCPYAESIAALEDLAPDAAENPEEFGCNYSLGQRLFTDLHRTLGGGATRQAIRDLYVLSQATDETEESTAEGAGISHVRQAFGHLPGASVPIARWYDGSEGYDLSQLDLTPADPVLPDINGRIDSAYITVGDGKKVVSGFSVSDAASGEVWLNLDYSYDVSNGERQVQLHLRSLYEDGFSFQDRTLEIEAESRYEGAAQSVWIGPDKVVPGRYWVYLYDSDRKVAEVQYEVTP